MYTVNVVILVFFENMIFFYKVYHTMHINVKLYLPISLQQRRQVRTFDIFWDKINISNEYAILII